MQTSEEQLTEMAVILGAKKVVEPGYPMMIQTLSVVTTFILIVGFAFTPRAEADRQDVIAQGAIQRYVHQAALDQAKTAGKPDKDIQQAEQALKKDDAFQEEQLAKATELKACMHAAILLALLILVILGVGVIRRRTEDDENVRKEAITAAVHIYNDLTLDAERPSASEVDRIVRKHTPKRLEDDISIKAKRIDWLLFGPRVAAFAEAK
ncbi:MAG TPA: hypothetical protein VIM58_03140 [Candidatus Methylacidiphilales bacterium]